MITTHDNDGQSAMWWTGFERACQIADSHR